MADEKPKTPTPDPAAAGTDDPAPGADIPSASPSAAGALARKTAEEIEELGGPQGAEPARYGDWERNGRCSDF